MSKASSNQINPNPSKPASCQLSFGENAIRVLQARYLKKDEKGQLLETPEDLFRRVARAIAEAEDNYTDDPKCRSEWEQRFYDLITSRRFMPNSPTLMNAGREMGMLSACFVLPVGDSVEEIFDAIKYTALIQKAGGGTGFAFDQLRPTGDYIKSSGGTTSGPISFWRAFSEATNAIQQGAFRRGANMGMMYVHHPDILKFLYAKQDLTQFTNYNISVKVPDQWMESLQANPQSPHVVINPRNQARFVIPKDTDIDGYDIHSLIPVDSDDPTVEPEVYTKGDIWKIIIEHAWQTGEPGVVFIDRINTANPTPHLGRMEATNPCGEQPLLPFEACNLGSINLAAFVRNGGTPDAFVDWEALRTTVDESVRFLDNVIDVNRYPLPQIDQICKANRKIGLGVMGFADALYLLNVPYNSDQGLQWGERFMSFINDQTHTASEALANERGCFQNWAGSTWDRVHSRKMRNACSTTVAPTGTISIIAGCSCGIEPLFGLIFYRNVLKGQDQGKQMVEINPIFARAVESSEILSEGPVMERIAKDGTLANIDELPETIKEVFVCANDVSPQWHVRMQAAFQKHCDSSISKTINFPNVATPEEVATIYELSYTTGCKGVTVYRDGCRQGQPMARQKHQKAQKENTTDQDNPGSRRRQPPSLVPVELPEVNTAVRTRQMTPFGNMHVQITVDPISEQELEVFAQLGKGGDLANSDLEAICRMISLWLRSGGSLQHVVHQLKGIGSSLQVSTKEGKIKSLGDGLARALEKYQRAKSCIGLRDLILGAFDSAKLNRDLASQVRHSAKPTGNGGSNGGTNPKNGNGNGNKRNQDPGTTYHRERHGLAGATPAVETAVGVRSSLQEFKVRCPECSEVLYFSEGCVKCEACGYAQC